MDYTCSSCCPSRMVTPFAAMIASREPSVDQTMLLAGHLHNTAWSLIHLHCLCQAVTFLALVQGVLSVVASSKGLLEPDRETRSMPGKFVQRLRKLPVFL